MDLYEIDTPEGGFRVGPELGRFLEVQTLDAAAEPAVDPFQATGTLPPSGAVGGEFAAANVTGLQARREATGVDSLTRSVQDTGQDAGQRPGTASRTATRARPATDELQDTRVGQRTATRGDHIGDIDLMAPGFGTPTVGASLDFAAPTGFGVGFGTPGEPRRDRDDDGGDDRPRDPQTRTGGGASVVEDATGAGWLNVWATALAGGGLEARQTPEDAGEIAAGRAGLPLPTAGQVDPDEELSSGLEAVDRLFFGGGDGGDSGADGDADGDDPLAIGSGNEGDEDPWGLLP